MGEFQNRLKSLREACGYTQDELSKQIGVSRSAIGMYESGSREPDFDTLEKFADFFNVDMNYLHGKTAKTTTLPESVLTAAERKTLNKYRELDPNDREYVDELIDRLLGKKSNGLENSEVKKDVG